MTWRLLLKLLFFNISQWDFLGTIISTRGVQHILITPMRSSDRNFRITYLLGIFFLLQLLTVIEATSNILYDLNTLKTWWKVYFSAFLLFFSLRDLKKSFLISRLEFVVITSCNRFKHKKKNKGLLRQTNGSF